MQSKDICKEREDIKNKQGDPHTLLEVNTCSHTNKLRKQNKSKLCSSLLKMRKVKKYDKSSKKNLVYIQKKIRSIRAQKGRTFLRSIILMQTKRRYLTEAEKGLISSYKSKKLQTDFKQLQNKETLRDEGNKHHSFRIADTKSSFTNKSPSAFSNRSQEVSANNGSKLFSPQSTATPIIFKVAAPKCQSTKVKSANEVWEHFIRFLHTKKEPIDKIISSGIIKENINTSDQESCNLDGTAREVLCQNLGKLCKTKESFIASEIPDNLIKKVSSNRSSKSVSMSNLIERLRAHILCYIIQFEKSLGKTIQDGHQEKNMQLKIKFLMYARLFKTKLHQYFDILFDNHKLCSILAHEILSSEFPKENSLNLTSLKDLPMSPANVQTLSSLFLYLYKTIQYEGQSEKIYNKMKFENFMLVYREFQARAARCKGEREMSEKDTSKLIFCFNASLEECRSKIKHEVPHSEISSLEEYQNYISDLTEAVSENLRCLKELLGVGSSMAFSISRFLDQSRLKTLDKLLFLDRISSLCCHKNSY